MFFEKKAAPTMGGIAYLVVGLGNPGEKYENTRHNAGFLAVDRLAQQQDVKIDRLNFQSLTRDVTVEGVRILLMKPSTFMNNSGLAVAQAAKFYKIPPEKILVLFDDVSLDVGRLRIRTKGSDGGHNGIKSILYHLESDLFPRIKIGVGQKPHPEYDLADWVLGKFAKADIPALEESLLAAADAVRMILAGKSAEAMNRYNTNPKKTPDTAER